MSPSVHRLHLATYKLAGEFNPPGYLDSRISIYGYLIVTDAGPLLVDTGIGEGNEYIDDTFEPARTSLREELARFDARPEDIGLIVNSHLHFDHCGNNRMFPDATVCVQARELATARALRTRYTVPWWFDYEGARIREVDGDGELVPGVRLIASPGHTPGHQSVLVDTGGRLVLVAAQASFTAEEYLRGGDPADQAHSGLDAAYVDSIVRLKAMGADETCFSHDARTVTGSGELHD